MASLTAGAMMLIGNAYAQQLPGDGFHRPLPNATWHNDREFSLSSTPGAGRQEFLMDARTGKQTDVTHAPRPQFTKPAVSIGRKGDIVLRDTIMRGFENVTLSPDSARVAYVLKNDLYVMDIATRRIWRVTNDGAEAVYNGKSSWVYNEEILGAVPPMAPSGGARTAAALPSCASTTGKCPFTLCSTNRATWPVHPHPLSQSRRRESAGKDRHRRCAGTHHRLGGFR